MADLIRARLYNCHNCSNQISKHDDIISKGFQSMKGRAFLFYEAKNVAVGPQQEKMLISGKYIVSDIFCCDCGEMLGWKYIRAYDESQKYKEGKVVLEKFKITKETWKTLEKSYFEPEIIVTYWDIKLISRRFIGHHVHDLKDME